MTLYEFEKDMQKELKKFKERWISGSILNSDHYPNELDEGEWYDQFLAWLSLNDKT